MKSNKFIYHLTFWLLAYGLWIFIFRNGTLVLTHALTIQFCYLIFIAGNYYFNSLYTVPALLNRKRYGAFGLCFLTGILIGAALRVPVSLLVTKYLFKVNIDHLKPISIFFDSFVNILFWVVLILVGKLIGEKINAERYIEQIEKEKSDNELNFLRAQFNPHFLFNSINSIYAHIDKSNKDARGMLLVFSDMLRYQLYECNVEEIEIDRELNYIRNYIALQKSRIDERIDVSFCDVQINGSVKVAPLVFIAFIENAFKYVGFNEEKDNHIHIKLSFEDGNLHFTVQNTKDLFINATERSSGLGITNVKRRLELLYPNRHLLKINDSTDVFLVELTLFNL